jgi:hypothetical protein
MTAMTFARILILTGIGMILIGGIVYLAARSGFPLGRLPGDIRIVRENVAIFIPCASMLLISLVLTLILNVVIRILNR